MYYVRIVYKVNTAVERALIQYIDSYEKKQRILRELESTNEHM
ncbi:hypothetical protein [Anaerobutyricum hallii]|nr:hypothetical protein [Anaerobutyricum hallii]